MRYRGMNPSGPQATYLIVAWDLEFSGRGCSKATDGAW